MENTKIKTLKASLDYVPLIDINKCKSKFKSVSKIDFSYTIKPYFIFTRNEDIWNNREKFLTNYNYTKSGCGIFAIVRGFKEKELGNCCKIEEEPSGCIIGFTAHKNLSFHDECPVKSEGKIAKYDLGMKFLKDTLLKDVVDLYAGAQESLQNSNALLESDVEIEDQWEASESSIFVQQQINANEAELTAIHLIATVDILGLESYMASFAKRSGELMEEFEDSFIKNESIRDKLGLGKDDKFALLENPNIKFIQPTTNVTFKEFVTGYEVLDGSKFLSLSNIIYDYVSSSILSSKLKGLNCPAKTILFNPHNYLGSNNEFLQQDMFKVFYTHNGGSFLIDLVEYIRGNDEIYNIGRAQLPNDLCAYIESSITFYNANAPKALGVAKCLKEGCGLSETMCSEFLEAIQHENIIHKNMFSPLICMGFYPIFIKNSVVVIGMYNPALKTLIISSPVFVKADNLNIYMSPYASYYMSTEPEQTLEFSVGSTEILKFANIIGLSQEGKLTGKKKLDDYMQSVVDSPMWKFLSYIGDCIADNINRYDDLFQQYMSRKKDIQQWMKNHNVDPSVYNVASCTGEKRLLVDIHAPQKSEATEDISTLVPPELNDIVHNSKITFEGSNANIMQSFLEHFMSNYFNFNDITHYMEKAVISKEVLQTERSKLLSEINRIDDLIAKNDASSKQLENSICLKSPQSIESYIQKSMLDTINVYAEDLDAIARFPRTTKVTLDSRNNRLLVDIKDTYVEDDRTGLMHDMGPVVISIPFNFIDSSVLKGADPKQMGWLYRHPEHGLTGGVGKFGRTPVVHGDGYTSGSACLGNAYSMFSDAMASNDLLGVFMTAVRYADSANTEDSRGSSVNTYKLKDGYSLVDDILPWYAGQRCVDAAYHGHREYAVYTKRLLMHLMLAPQTFKEFADAGITERSSEEDIADMLFHCFDMYNQKNDVKIIYPGDGFGSGCALAFKTYFKIKTGSFSSLDTNLINAKFMDHYRRNKALTFKNTPLVKALVDGCHFDPKNLFAVFQCSKDRVVRALSRRHANYKWNASFDFPEMVYDRGFPIIITFKEKPDDKVPQAFATYRDTDPAFSNHIIKEYGSIIQELAFLSGKEEVLDSVASQLNEIFS